MAIVDSLLNEPITPYATVVNGGGDNVVRDGDIMLASGTYAFSELIKLGTKSPGVTVQSLSGWTASVASSCWKAWNQSGFVPYLYRAMSQITRVTVSHIRVP